MSDEGRRRIYKVRGNKAETPQPAVVAVPHGTSLPNLLRVPSVAVHTQAGVALIDSGIPQTMSLQNTQAQTHSQTVIQTHAQIQAQNQRFLESLGHTHIQSDIQANNVHSPPHMQTQSQVLIQSQVQTQPQVHSQQHMHPQPLTHTPPLVQVQSQLTHAHTHLHTQMPVSSQTPVMQTIADLVHTQIDNMPPQQTAKPNDELPTERIPVTRHQHSSNPVNMQDLQSPSLDLNEMQPSNSQAKLLSVLTSLAESNQLNPVTVGGTQQGNLSLSQAFSQQFTQAQILDALVADKVLIASKDNLGQTTVTPVSSVCTPGIDGLSLMRVQGNYTATRAEDGTSTLVTQDRISTGHNSLVESQMINPQISTSHLQLETSKLETSQASNMSTLITSNKILNRLLDTTKPHIPSHVAKAAELAHLIPNPSVRVACSVRSGESEDSNLDMVFCTSSRGSSPLTTLTRSSGASVCMVTGALRSSSGYGDSINKVSPTLQLENVSLPSSFQLNNSSLLLSTLAGQSQIPHQRQFDASQQTLLGSQNATNIEESQLDGLGNDALRFFPALTVGQSPPVSNCIVTGVNTLAGSSADKTPKKVIPTLSNQTNNVRSVGTIGLPEMMNKSNSILESHTRPQSTKQGLITSTDPMFPSVVTSTNSPASALSSFGLSKPGVSSQDTLPRVKAHIADSRMSQLAITDLINRGSSSDIMLGGGNGNLLLGMPETRISHTGDVLLSELHRSDESDLSLSSSLTGTGDDLHSNASTLVTDASLGTGIVPDTAPLHGLPASPPLQGLPSPPLPSFSLPITSDFMVGGISGSKLSSGQVPFPALLSNLATTSDFDQFLENSIDINSLSESEVSLSTTNPSSFAYSPEKSPHAKKSASSPSSDLTFTSALKAANLKNESDEMKLHCETDSSVRIMQHRTEGKSSSQADVTMISSSCNVQSSVAQFSQSSVVKQETPLFQSKKQDVHMLNKPTSAHSEKRKEIFRKNELLVQQVACFKCRLCSFLSQDKGEMVNHMKDLHSQYLSDSEDSETEEGPASKKMKVHVPSKDSLVQDNSMDDCQTICKIRPKKDPKKQGNKDGNMMENCNSDADILLKKIIKEEDEDSGRVRVFIKAEPNELGKARDNSGEAQMTAPDPDSDQEFDDEDTNDSSATSDSGSVKPKKTYSKLGRPMFSKSTGITKFKKSNPKAKISEKVVGIRCDVNGCGLRMKSESNITYHRKCHVGAKLNCQECGATFGMWCNLAVHLWRQHLIDMELHKCDKCNYKSYSHSKLMNVHYMIHSEERPSLCDICGKRFKTAKQLRSHKGVHARKMNSPQLRCEKCQRPFSDKRMLRNHMASVHNKVKPFLCNYCGYSTASKSTLKMHMRQHTGEKPFACDKCTYRTADHNSLRRHRMQHSGVRPYQCPYCEYASIQATTFKVHLRDKHASLAQVDGIVFTCGVCKFETIKKDNYLAHVAEHGRSESKKLKQLTNVSSSNTKIPTGVQLANVTSSKSNLPPGTIISSTPVPHVVNIDVESGAVTVESPQSSPYVNTVNVQDNLQTQVPGQVAMGDDQYIYAAVDSSVLSRVRSGEGVMRISPDVVAIPLSVSSDTGGTPPIQGLVYVATSSQGGD